MENLLPLDRRASRACGDRRLPLIVGVVMKKLDPVTPGELLLEEFLKPMGISQYRLAKDIRVPAQRIGEIVAGKRSITADTDLRLCRFFGLSKDRKSTRLNSSHSQISYAVFCL